MNKSFRLGTIILCLAALVLGAWFVLHSLSEPAPNVQLKDSNGKPFHLSDYRGRVVLVNFWATTCTTCMKEMPELASTQQKFAAQGFQTIAVAMNYDSPQFIANFIKATDLPFRFVHDVDGSAGRAFATQLTPTSFLIDKKGNVVMKILGIPDWSNLHQKINSLLVQ